MADTQLQDKEKLVLAENQTLPNESVAPLNPVTYGAVQAPGSVANFQPATTPVTTPAPATTTGSESTESKSVSTSESTTYGVRPVWDESKIAGLTQKAAAPGIRSLRDALREGTRRRFDNPNVGAMTLKQALSGYGSGLSKVMGGAAQTARSQYGDQYGRDLDLYKFDMNYEQRERDIRERREDAEPSFAEELAGGISLASGVVSLGKTAYDLYDKVFKPAADVATTTTVGKDAVDALSKGVKPTVDALTGTGALANAATLSSAFGGGGLSATGLGIGGTSLAPTALGGSLTPAAAAALETGLGTSFGAGAGGSVTYGLTGQGAVSSTGYSLGADAALTGAETATGTGAAQAVGSYVPALAAVAIVNAIYQNNRSGQENLGQDTAVRVALGQDNAQDMVELENYGQRLGISGQQYKDMIRNSYLNDTLPNSQFAKGGYRDMIDDIWWRGKNKSEAQWTGYWEGSLGDSAIGNLDASSDLAGAFYHTGSDSNTYNPHLATGFSDSDEKGSKDFYNKKAQERKRQKLAEIRKMGLGT